MAYGNGILSGYKTHISAALLVVGAIASYLVGDIPLNEMFLVILNGGAISGLRDAIKKATEK